MSRNKENKPLPSQTRANGSVFGQAKRVPTEEFFTDSLLDDTSRIPSPSPMKSKAALSRPRRAAGAARPLHGSRDTVNAVHRSSSPSSGASRTRKHLQPAPVLTRPSNFKPSQRDLITPPQSRDGLEVKSPTSDVSSPPRGLTEVYQRIDDEQELADADREGGSSESGSDMSLPVDDQSPMRPRRNGVSKRSPSSRGSTPVRIPRNADKENRFDELTGSLSEGTGVSFLKGLTDQNIAAAVTPAVSSHVKDMKRLKNGISSKPISFDPGVKPSQRFAQEELEVEQKSARPVAFRFAGKLNGNAVEKAHSDTSIEERPRPQAFRLASLASQEPIPQPQEEDDDGYSTPEELRKKEQSFVLGKLTRKMLSSRSSDKRSELNDTRDVGEAEGVITDDSNTASDDETHDLKGQLTSLQSELSRKLPVRSAARGFLDKWRRATSEAREQRAPSFTSQTSSSVNWGEIDEEKPMPSVENRERDTTQVSPPRSEVLESLRSQKSMNRLRIWENDFTGTSFQVSESPPVKSRKNAEDYVREKEMERLSKQAVTTNRLDAIREKDPREAQRRLSKSSSANTLRKVSTQEEPASEAETQQMSEQIPDTPIVVFRSSSGGSKETRPTTAERPSQDRSTSHELMQRLAKLGGTPRSSPAPPVQEEEAAKQVPEVEDEPTQNTYPSSAQAPEVQEEPDDNKRQTIAATPKVIGAWIDTVLPDTIKTVKQREKNPSKYVATPHVSAGGWIDTPIPSGNRQSSALAPMTIEEEVTEDLDTDVVPKQNPQPGAPAEPKPESISPVEIDSQPPSQPIATRPIPPSALASILSKTRERAPFADITTAQTQEDTFEIGDATMASMENLVVFDPDVTLNLSRIIDERARGITKPTEQMAEDDDFVDRMYVKLKKVLADLHNLGRHATQLEHQAAGLKDSDETADLQELSQALNAYNALQQGSPTLLPPTLSLLQPLLFHPAPKTTSSLLHRFRVGRPTPLGYSLISLLTWYFLECLLSELFCHPVSADRYAWPSYAYNEPSFGLVAPSLLLHAVGINNSLHISPLSGALWTAISPAYTLFRAFYRIVAIWVGWSDGFVDDVREAAVRNASQVVDKVIETVTQTGKEGWSMMNDELL